VAGDVRKAFDAAVRAAKKDKLLGPLDAGAIAGARALADKIDAWDVIVDWAQEDIDGIDGARPAVPAHDNTSLPAFLKFCESLGLTPTGRKGVVAPAKEAAPSGPTKLGRLALLQDGARRPPAAAG
jgi:hypothetical protein